MICSIFSLILNGVQTAVVIAKVFVHVAGVMILSGTDAATLETANWID